MNRHVRRTQSLLVLTVEKAVQRQNGDVIAHGEPNGVTHRPVDPTSLRVGRFEYLNVASVEKKSLIFADRWHPWRPGCVSKAHLVVGARRWTEVATVTHQRCRDDE